MNEYISLNISYLINEKKLNQILFAELFDLTPGQVNTYVKGKATPKLDTIQQICEYFKVSIDNFVNRDLSKGKPQNYTLSDNMHYVAEGGGAEQAMFIVEKLEASLKDKEIIIDLQRQRINDLEAELKKYKKTKTKQQAG